MFQVSIYRSIHMARHFWGGKKSRGCKLYLHDTSNLEFNVLRILNRNTRLLLQFGDNQWTDTYTYTVSTISQLQLHTLLNITSDREVCEMEKYYVLVSDKGTAYTPAQSCPVNFPVYLCTSWSICLSLSAKKTNKHKIWKQGWSLEIITEISGIYNDKWQTETN